MSYYTTKRPTGVTFVTALVWLIAFFSMVRGMLALLGYEFLINPSDLGGDQGTAYGLIELAIGVLTALVALGLASGRRGARFFVSILMCLRIGASVWVALQFQGPYVTLLAILIGAWAVLILMLLWTPAADRFFTYR